MKNRPLIALLVTAALAAGCGVGTGAGGKLTWKVGALQCSTDCGFLTMAEEKGYFERRDVDVEIVKIGRAHV